MDGRRRTHANETEKETTREPSAAPLMREYPVAIACFASDLDALLIIHRVPMRHRIRVRTTNLVGVNRLWEARHSDAA
jgi:hypothetical protein